MAAGTEDTAYTITAATLLAGVTDVDGPTLSITSVSVASGGGSIVNNGNGTWTYTPAANDSGPVSFNYTASDGSLSSSSTASLIIDPVNDAPVATPVTLAAGTEDTAYIINAATLLAGVTDVDGPTLSITSVSVASGGGSIVNNGNGTWTYTPAANVSGPVSFSYTASDGSLSSSSTASLTLDAGQRRAGDHGGIADGGRGRHGADHIGQYRGDGSRQFKLCLHGQQRHPWHLPDHDRRRDLDQCHHLHHRPTWPPVTSASCTTAALPRRPSRSRPMTVPRSIT